MTGPIARRSTVRFGLASRDGGRTTGRWGIFADVPRLGVMVEKTPWLALGSRFSFSRSRGTGYGTWTSLGLSPAAEVSSSATPTSRVFFRVLGEFVLQLYSRRGTRISEFVGAAVEFGLRRYVTRYFSIDPHVFGRYLTRLGHPLEVMEVGIALAFSVRVHRSE